MNNSKKTKFISAFMALVMLIGVFSLPISALQNPLLPGYGDSSQYLHIEDGLNTTVDEMVASGELSLALNGITYSDSDRVSVIVRTEFDSMMTRAKAAGMSVSDYVLSDAGKVYAAELEEELNQVIASCGGLIANVKYRYTTVFTGFSCVMTYGDLKKVNTAAHVSNTLIAERYEKQDTDTVTDNALNAYSTGIYNSSEVGYTGEGMLVAVLDTGLDYTHSAFQTTPKGTLSLTADQIEELFPYLTAAELDETAKWENVYHSKKVPFTFDYADNDWDVYPTNDHGTHVAGIIAGLDDTITGVAVDAQLAIFKVFGNKDQGAPQEAILAALSDAVLLGVDVINMSLGSSCGFSRAADEDGVNEIYDSVREAGINLIVAASNSHSSAKGSTNGDTNLASNPDSATIGSPATYPSSLAIASVLGAKSNYLYANGEKAVYLTNARNSLSDEDIKFYELLLKGSKTAEYEYVTVPGVGNDSNYSGLDLTGKIAVVKRGVSTFEDKAETAKAHGAVGLIIYNNVSGTISATIGLCDLPTCMISMDDGVYFESHTTGTITLNAEYLAGPFMSDFSSWGPNNDLELSPDVTSYGGEIKSAVRGGYDIYSGTSMACPNFAGSAALVREYVKKAYPEMTADEVTARVNQLLMSTASVLYNQFGNPYSPRKQGSGLADAGRAIASSAFLSVDGSDKSKLSLKDDPKRTGVYEMTFRLTNTSALTRSYFLDVITMTETMSSDGKTVAEQAYILSPSRSYAVTGGFLNGNCVTVGGYGEALITVTVTLSDDDRAYLEKNFVNGMYVEGFVTLTSSDGDADLTIPYLAFYGDWTEAPLLDVTAFEVGAEQKDTSIVEDEKLTADVYATIPFVGYYSGTEITYYYMGKAGYVLADGYEQIATLEEYCSLTNHRDGNFMLYGISAGLLRNAKKAYMTITDSVTGEVIFEREEENCRKSYYSSAQTGGYVMVEFDCSEAGLSNNRKYTFDMTVELDWDGEQNNKKNTFSFSFYIDDEAPVLETEKTELKVKKDTNGNITGYSLDIYVYDNHYVQGYMLSTYDSLDKSGKPVNSKALFSGMVPVDDFVKCKSNKITIDLSSHWYDLVDGEEEGSKNFAIQIVDYAKNSHTYCLTLSKVDATEVIFENGKKSTANGDEISFNLKPNAQINLLSYLKTSPEDVYTKDLEWTTSDASVATVVNGMVTTLKPGTVTVTATSATGASASVTVVCAGTASSSDIPLSGLMLSQTAVTLERGESVELYVTAMPYNVTTQPTVTWTSSASAYVTLIVDPENPYHCTAVASNSGSATVTVRADGARFSASCRVGVKQEFEITGALLSSYTGGGDENGVVEIPADKGITVINRFAFLNNEKIRKIIIPEGVKEIQYAAIYGCENLEEVVLPSTCKIIGEFALSHNPALTTINTEHVETIFRLAFYGDSALKAVDLSSCHTICEYAFGNCSSLTSLDISKVGSIEQRAFVYCTGLTELITSEQNKIPDYCFIGCSSLGKLELKATYIGEYAFYNCSYLTEVTFLSDVSEIDRVAFYNCSSLVKLSFRKTVRAIDEYAFCNCRSLQSIYIPAGCQYLGSFAFGNCASATSVTFSADADLREIGINPFYAVSKVQAFMIEAGNKYMTVERGILYNKNKTKLILVPFALGITSFSIPETVTEIGDYAFSLLPSLSGVRTNSVRRIGKGAFYDSGLRSITLGTALEEIDERAFYSCDYLTSLDLPESLTTIGDYAFSENSTLRWNNLVLSENVTSIGEGAFYKNELLTGLELPDSLTEIPAYAFGYCVGLNSVKFGNGVEKIGDYAFAYDSSLVSLTIPDSVESLGVGCFGAMTSLASVRLPAGITEIPELCFYADEALSDIILPDSVTVIGKNAFRASGVTSFDFNQVTEIGDYAFAETKLTVLNAEKVQKIGDYAFYTSKLTSATLPAIESIGAFAFAASGSLKDLKIENVKNVGEYAFYACTLLTSVTLPNCTEIGNNAFSHNPSLTELSLPAAEKIGSYIVYGTGVETFTVAASVKEIAPNAFTTKLTTSTDDAVKLIKKLTVEDGNQVFFLDEQGVLYRNLIAGGYELVSYPAGFTATEYTVLQGTVRIADYAFYTNTYLKNLTVARTVAYIGTGAFKSCTSLEGISFLSVEAPILESYYSSASVDGWTYENFVTEIPGEGADALSIQITVPSNAVRYDSYLWTRYIGQTVSSGQIGMTNSTAYLIEKIEGLAKVLTLDDAAIVDYLDRVFRATTSDQKSLIPSELVSKLNDAVAQIAKLRGENAGNETEETTTSPETESSGEQNQFGSYTVLWIVLGAVCVLAVAGGVTIAVLKKGRNTNA